MGALIWDAFAVVGIWFVSSLITLSLAAAVATANKRGKAE